MTTNPSIWRIEGNELVEQSEYKIQSDFDIKYPNGSYKRYLQTLRRFPHNLPDSLKGKDLKEGQYFRLQKQINVKINNDLPEWENATDSEFWLESIKYRRIIALPISQPEQPISEEGKEVVTDDELTKAWGSANFGSTPKRKVIFESLSNIACGYHNGHTANSIMLELGLIEAREKGRYHVLTDKGLKYLLSTPSQEAIEFAEWKDKMSIQDSECPELYRLNNFDGAYYRVTELYQLYTEHKNSKA